MITRCSGQYVVCCSGEAIAVCCRYSEGLDAMERLARDLNADTRLYDADGWRHLCACRAGGFERHFVPFYDSLPD